MKGNQIIAFFKQWNMFFCHEKIVLCLLPSLVSLVHYMRQPCKDVNPLDCILCFFLESVTLIFPEKYLLRKHLKNTQVLISLILVIRSGIQLTFMNFT